MTTMTETKTAVQPYKVPFFSVPLEGRAMIVFHDDVVERTDDRLVVRSTDLYTETKMLRTFVREGEYWVQATEAPEQITFDLAGFVDHQAAHYDNLHHGAGDLIAKALRDLAQTIRFVDATTPKQYLDRIATLQEDYAYSTC